MDPEAALTPERRALLERMREEGVEELHTFPASFAQARLWFLHQMEPESPFYNTSGAFSLEGALDVDALHRALAEIVRRHEALRTVFAGVGGAPVQVVFPRMRVPLPLTDLSSLPEAERAAAVRRLADEEGRAPFDLARGPLLRLRLLRLAAEEHVLLLSMHHVVSDGWSMGVLFRELGALYEAFSGGAPSPLPELPVQYADFAVWQREHLSGGELEAQLDWWRRQLEGAPEVLELPADRPRPAVPTYRGAIHAFTVPQALVPELIALGRREGATLFMTCLAAFQVLLARYSGEDDVVVGSAIANRTRPELEGLIGFFVNMLVLRARLGGDPDFRTLLARVREATLQAYAHQDLPFERLVEELAPERAVNRHPLFQVGFVLQNAPVRRQELPGLRLRVEPVDVGTSRLDLLFSLREGGEGLEGAMEYSTDLWDEESVRRMGRHYVVLLEAIVRDPARRVSRLPLAPAEERAALLADWAAGERIPRAETLAHAAFQARAAASPDAPAVVSADESLTYAELDARANRLARHLRRRGIGPESRVGICLERGVDLVAAILAVVKAGGAYVPLDPSYPRERISHMLADSGARLVVTRSDVGDVLPEDVERVRLDAHADAISRESADPVDSGVGPENLAYVVYTSGSTGRPKGVMATHAGVANLVAAQGRAFAVDGGSRVLQFASPSFDAAASEIFVTLGSGGALHLAERNALMPGPELIGLLRERAITHVTLPPSALAALPAEDAPRLRTLVMAGEALPGALASRWAPKTDRLLNAYGPTETTVCATIGVVEGDGDAHPPIGRPIPNAGVYVLDGRMEPVPVGVPGELYVGGAGVARGYLGRPALTAVAFVPDPFSGDRGGRLYRTGDRVRWRADGTLHFLGRVDQQVKVRGFRIEPGEVEAVLAGHPAVRQAAVVAREDAPGDTRLVAYVVPAPDLPTTDAETGTAEHLGEWETVFEEAYADAANDTTFNVAGWNSSYTGQPIPAEEMRVWVESTVARIRALSPRRVLEIGCGTGLLLHRIAPTCETYVGTDFSRSALAAVERERARRPELARVRLLERAADDFSGLEPGSFDTVVINSVVQYFPDVDYLLRVLDGAARVLAPGGRIFLGDVRSLPLLAAFHASVQRFQAASAASVAALRQHVDAALAQEQEMVVDPALFHALHARFPALRRVTVALKRGPAGNELATFRHDVTLHFAGGGEPEISVAWRRWDGETVDGVRGTLERERPPLLGISRVPDARLAADLAFAARLRDGDAAGATVAALEAELREAAAGAVDPDALWEMAESLGYRAEIGWAGPGAEGAFDVLFRRLDGDSPADARPVPPAYEAPVDSRPWSAYASQPLAARRRRELVPALRAHLQARLPEYMVPAAIVTLDALPLTPSGKVDRRALPAPDALRPELEVAYAAPRTPLEQAVADVWATVLGVERVGIHDSFFELGGHSLLATRVVSRLRTAAGAELPVRALFEAPTVAGLAAAIERLRGEVSPDAAPDVAPATRGGLTEAPLSFAQRRLWFLEQLEPRRSVYGSPLALRVEGPLDATALERSLAEIVRRHAALRTTFHDRGGEPVQVVSPPGAFRLEMEDLSALPAGEREAEAARRVREEVERPFDLAVGPLFRAVLLRISESDHALVLAMHHVVADGWSLGVLFRELGELYAAFSAGQPSPLAELPLQYPDFAAWQREHLEGEPLERQLAWWHRRLEGAPPALALPTDRPRPAVQSFRGARERVVLDPALTARLRKVAQREGATLYMVLLAALDVLLWRYTGERDVVVGTPVAGRTRPELEPLVGLFTNTLALRTELEGDPTFRNLLGRVREGVLEAFAHQDLPFERLVEALHPERDPGRQPVFQVLFALQNALPSEFRLPGVRLSGFEFEPGTSRFDLALSFWERGDEVSGTLEYATDLFDAATARRMAEHYRALLEAAAAAPDRAIGELPLLREPERARVLHEWNATRAETPPDRRAHALVAAWAARAPDAPALVSADGALSYAEMEASANRLAQHLRKQGIGPESRVGVCLDRGAELIVAILAVLKAGGAYVPLDPAYPRERISHMLADSGARLVVTRSDVADVISGEIERILLDADAEEIARESSGPIDSGVGAENLAYVIYTSGSTGRPKGVMVTHAGVANLVAAQGQAFAVDGDSRVLQFASPSFDAAVSEIFVTLGNGGALHLAERDALLPGRELAELFAARGITHVTLPPSALAALPADETPRLRTLVLAGEALPAALAAEWAPRADRLLNAYGPTEATVCASIGAFAEGDAQPSIGGPIANARVYVLDERMEPAPVGVPGELYVGGAGVARGYLGRPALTAAAFVPDPFSGEPGARLYRTGDRARWRADGTLAFMGRLDEQVKVRGFRIELGEIEGVLRRTEGVTDCVVVARGDAGETRLVAYVVGHVEVGVVREHLRRELPEYMVPAAFVPLDALPLTPSGKVDRRALPAPEAEGSGDGDARPQTPVEEVLAGIWAAVLKAEHVGLHDGFFELGGHSLLATQAISRVRAALGVDLPLRALFEAPTVAALARRVEEARAGADALLPPVTPANRSRPLPLSFAQRRLWLLHQIDPESPSYNVPVGARLRGALAVDALRRALTEVVRRHEALRTVFRAGVDGEPVQVVLPPSPIPLPVDDISHLTGDEREMEMRRRLADEARRPFDLATGPVLRTRLLRLGDDEHVLALVIHHAFTDGWSMGVLFRELSALYGACVEGGDSPLADLPVQYADHAVWQHAHLAGGPLAAQLAWWRAALAGAPPALELPTDRPRPATHGFRAAVHRFALPAELGNALSALARREGATLFMTLLAAFDVLLQRWTGESDLLVGTPMANRTRPETEPLIGFFANTLALRADLSGDPTFAEVVARVREATLEAWRHADVPFERVVAELGGERDASRHPLVQAMFALQNTPPARPAFAGVSAEPVEADTGATEFDLTLLLAERDGALEGALRYAADLFDAETAERMAGQLALLLEEAVADPERRVSTFPLLRPDERARALAAAEGPVVPLADPRPVHLRVAEHARRAPDRPAIVAAGETVTYGELDRRAAALARVLREMGVGPEDRVAVCLERGSALAVAQLAALKAGGSYVPLDPVYPAERIALSVRDSGARVLLTRAGHRDALPPLAASVVSVDEVGDGEMGDDPSPEMEIGPDRLAYVVYTSGSTGTPKGVAVTHGGLANLAAWHLRAFGVAADDRGTLLAGVGFDASAWELWPLLAAGAAVHVPPEEVRTEPPALRDWLLTERVTISFLPTPLAEAVLALEWPAEAPLRTLLTGGDRLRARPRPDLPFTLVNAYGPTETTVVATFGAVEPEGGDARRAPGIGAPIDNARAYVLDGWMEPVGDGVPGELCVGGAGVARGYLGRPAQTAAAFVPDPFSTEPGARLYCTGDRVRRRADGVLEFLGRLDAQVKVRGHRVEPGEVEAVLRAHPAVRDAVVVAREDRPGDARLVAYVVPSDGDLPTEEIRTHLRAQLPEFMVPTAWVALDAFPLSPSGKVDRRALPAPEIESEEAYVAPRTPAEEALAAVWAEVLSVERVGVHDNFFALGGHSLTATQAVSRARAALGAELPLRAIFEAPTVAGLAARIGPDLDRPRPAGIRPRARGAGGLEAALRELGGMSEEEVKRLIAEKTRAGASA